MVNLEWERRAERVRVRGVAAMERSRALAEEHARRLESQGDRAGAEREWARVRLAEQLLERMRGPA